MLYLIGRQREAVRAGAVLAHQRRRFRGLIAVERNPRIGEAGRKGLVARSCEERTGRRPFREEGEQLLRKSGGGRLPVGGVPGEGAVGVEGLLTRGIPRKRCRVFRLAKRGVGLIRAVAAPVQTAVQPSPIGDQREGVPECGSVLRRVERCTGRGQVTLVEGEASKMEEGTTFPRLVPRLGGVPARSVVPAPSSVGRVTVLHRTSV